MSINQSHGKTIEDVIKSCFHTSSDSKRKSTSKFDIESEFDKIKNIPTSIKSTQNKIVGLSDARRFFSINENFRLLVVRYKQIDKDIKEFYEFREYNILTEELKTIRGDLTIDDIEYMHNLLKSYPPGKMGYNLYKIEWRKDSRVDCSHKKPSFIKLNPKVDSKKQRRLQCSINLKTLDDIIKDHTDYKEFYRGISVNIKLQSSRRIFKKKLGLTKHVLR